jgi:predicted O-methyltransferase YrrM
MTYNLTIPGWMDEPDLRYIEYCAMQVPPQGQMIEVGSFCGRSAWAWAKSAPTATLLCIDVWPGNIIGDSHLVKLSSALPHPDGLNDVKHFDHFTADCPNIKRIIGDSQVILPSLSADSYDLIFIDAIHSNPVFGHDVHTSWRLLKPGGVLCGHDFSIEFPDVISTCKRFAAVCQLPMWFGGNSIWVIKKP